MTRACMHSIMACTAFVLTLYFSSSFPTARKTCALGEHTVQHSHYTSKCALDGDVPLGKLYICVCVSACVEVILSK